MSSSARSTSQRLNWKSRKPPTNSLTSPPDFLAVPALKKQALIGLLLAIWAVSASAREVVVASFNVHNYLAIEAGIPSANPLVTPKPESEIAAVIEIIREIKPDILGLVEMGDASMLADLQGRLKGVGLDFPHSEWVKGADSARHIALLSRYPVVARQSRDDVPIDLNGVKTRISRGILDVTVRLAPDYDLRLVGVHLKSRRQVPEFDESAMRAREAWHVRQHLDAILEASPDTNLMLFGDLNDTKNEYPIRELVGVAKSPTYMRDLALADRSGLRWTHFWSAADEYSRIDFLLVSNGLWPEIDMSKSGVNDSKVWAQASDHRAIFAALKIPKK